MLYIWLRWARLTIRRYGLAYLGNRARPRHAGVGRGLRRTTMGRAHGWGTPAMLVVRVCQRERGIFVPVVGFLS
jgi:hypothetical protein